MTLINSLSERQMCAENTLSEPQMIADYSDVADKKSFSFPSSSAQSAASAFYTRMEKTRTETNLCGHISVQPFDEVISNFPFYKIIMSE
jgi:hypothetical protein